MEGDGHSQVLSEGTIYRTPTEERRSLEAGVLLPTREAILASTYRIRPGTATDELDAVARLRLDPSTPRELWELLADMVTWCLAEYYRESA